MATTRVLRVHPLVGFSGVLRYGRGRNNASQGSCQARRAGTTRKGAGFPTPVMAKAGPMPTHQGLRSDDSDGPEHRWKPSIQQDQEQAIPICELDATPHPALQHNQLMTERRVLGLKSALRLERRDGEGQKEQKSAIIAVDVRRFGHAIIRMRLSVHTGISSR